MPAAPFDDMTDTPDEKKRYGDSLPFHAFSVIYTWYEEVDKAALTHQTLHALLTASAVWGGAFAVIIGVFGLAAKEIPSAFSTVWLVGMPACTVWGLGRFFWNRRGRLGSIQPAVWITAGIFFLGALAAASATSRKEFLQPLLGLELWAIVVVLYCFCCGSFANQKEKWLALRHRAEFYRHLKYQLLIHHERWSDRGWLHEESSRESILRGKNQNLEKWSDEELKEYLQEAITTLPHRPLVSYKPPPDRVLPHVVEYYKSKRLHRQMAYLKSRLRSHDQRDEIWNTLLQWLFPIGIGVAIMHLVVEIAGRATKTETPGRWEAVAAFVAVSAAALPIVSAGIRAWRGAYEFARNRSRFAAAYDALEDLEQNFLRPEDNPDAEKVLEAIHRCERILSNEHIEWLRLMMEAEWNF